MSSKPSTNNNAVAETSAEKSVTKRPLSKTARFVNKLPGTSLIKKLQIGPRLVIGFSLLVIFTVLIITISYVRSRPAVIAIDRTASLRAPTTLAAATARVNLWRMSADTQGYLALGDPQFKERYLRSAREFEASIEELKSRSDELDSLDQLRLANIEAAYNEWRPLPRELFALRDDRLEREPAYKIVATDGTIYAGEVILNTQELIELQAEQDPSEENMALLKTMADFQGSFASMLSGLRNYVTTQNRIYRQEYEVSRSINQIAWDKLLEQAETQTAEDTLLNETDDGTDSQSQALLNSRQIELIEKIDFSRELFLGLPEDQVFPILETNNGEGARLDLQLFRSEAVPKIENMLSLLDDLTQAQQEDLTTDLSAGKQGLDAAVRQTLIVGAVIVVVSVFMIIVFREMIAGPVGRLTDVAEDIYKGDLDAQAEIESNDEIGTLARTFNNMTSRLRGTLIQVRKEKKRADDLLDVVIPIGVDLSSEKDFNRLMEKMLVEAKSFCQANAGILYLYVDEELRPTIVRNDDQDITLGGSTGKAIVYPPVPIHNADGTLDRATAAVKTAVDGETVNISNVQEEGRADSFTNRPEVGYIPTTSLSIPISDSKGNVSGVLQLLDPRDPDSKEIVPFDKNLQQMMESFSSLAAAALEAYMREQVLRQEIKQLRIEIDKTKQQKEVEEITGTDFFRELQAKASEMRTRSRRSKRRRNIADSEKSEEQQS